MKNLNFLYQMDLPHRAVAVYTYLYDRANKDGICWPSVNTISKDIKLSPATVRRGINDLKKAGLITYSSPIKIAVSSLIVTKYL